MKQTLRQIVAVLALGSIALSLVPNALAASFSTEAAANELAAKGYINDHTANPADYALGSTLLRQEAVKVAGKAQGIIPDVLPTTPCKSRYSDVTEQWVCQVVEIAAENGLTKAEGTFGPHANLSKYEAMVFALRSACIDIPVNSGPNEIAVQAAGLGYITTAGSFNGTAPATRGEFFKYVATAMEDSTCAPVEDDICTYLPALCEDDVDVPPTTGDNTGDVTVTLNSNSPGARTVPNSGLVPFGMFDLKAGSDGATVTSLTLKREGLSNRSDIQRVYFEQDGVRVSNRANVTVDDTVILSFSPALEIAAGKKVTLDLIVELANPATVGAEHKFSVVGSNAATAMMRLGSYTVQVVDIDAVSGGTSVNVGDMDVLLGEFRLNTAGDKDNVFKSVTLRNDGTADVGASLTNLALYNDGQKVSTDVQINGRDTTFTVNANIENGSSENYEIRADITGAERSSETYILKVRNSTDMTVTEKETGFSAPIETTPGNFTALGLGTVTVTGGDTLLSRDTSFTSSQTVSPNTANVVLWAGKLNVTQAVELEDIAVNMNLSGGADLNQISSMRFIVDGSTVASYSPSATPATGVQIVPFDAQFTVSKNSTMRIEANLRNTANGNINTTSVTLGSTDARYVSNDEAATVLGGANGISTDVSNATLSVTQNDGIDNFTLVSGAKNVTVLGFALRSNDVSDVKVTAISPVIGGTVLMSNISNVRLYKGDTLVSTKNNFDFNNLNITIPKNTSVSYKIVADFNTSVAAAQTLSLSLSTAQVTARDISSNATATVSGTAAITGPGFTFASAGTLTASVNSSQANATIISPATAESSVFKFDVEAKNDKSRVTDVYIKNTGGVDLAQALRSASLTLGDQTATAVVLDANNLHFSFGSQGVTLNRDEKLTADFKVAFWDSSARTNLAFQFSLPAATVTGEVTGTQNGMRVVSDSTGNTLARAGGVVSSNSHLLARSKPTVASTTFTPSTNELYRFSVTADANRKVTLQDVALSIQGSAAANLTGATISIYRDNESAGNLVFTNRVSNQTLGTATPTAAGAGVAQVSTLTPTNVEIGDVFTATIDGTAVSYTATANTVANVTAGLTAAINANGTVSPVVTATENGAVITVTADVVNTVFTIVPTTTNGSSAYVANVGNRDVAAGQTVQYIVKISGGAPVADDIREARVTQVVYSDEVDSPANISIANYNLGVPTTVASYKY